MRTNDVDPRETILAMGDLINDWAYGYERGLKVGSERESF